MNTSQVKPGYSRRAAVMAMVLGTALGTMATAAPARAEANGRAAGTVNDMSRYCTVCWRNARLHPDSWSDCTQEVFSRMLERVEMESWDQALRGDGGNSLSEVPHGVFGQDVLVHDVQADPVVELLAGEDRMHTGQVLGLGSVHGNDLRPGVGALFHLGVKHAGKYQVARVHGPAGELGGVVDPLDVVANVGRRG